jgi:hypothetical protein
MVIIYGKKEDGSRYSVKVEKPGTTVQITPSENAPKWVKDMAECRSGSIDEKSIVNTICGILEHDKKLIGTAQ